MARRSDHSRAELREMIVVEGHRQIEQSGFARFSARELAKRIGYTIGTLYNVFGNHDLLVLAINARTMVLWQRHLEARLLGCSHDRIGCLVDGYFEFAQMHRNAWAAIYDHRMPEGEVAPAWYVDAVANLTAIVIDEVGAALPASAQPIARQLSFSLLAVVHGHCDLEMTGTFAVLGQSSPRDAALARVRETLASAINRDKEITP